MKRSLAFLTAVLMSLSFFVPLASADTDLSEAQLTSISENCSSIKIQLQQLQRADAKSRVHLGAQYETISSNLILNLNLRLVKNNLANADIAEQQTTFASERTRFKNDYIGYSQALDKLISIDCKANPQAFYQQLKLTQKKRADVDKSIERLNMIISRHRESVKKLKEEL